MIAEDKLQAAARAVHEALKGKGTWNDATKEERSGARHLVRVMLVAANLDEQNQNGTSELQSVVGGKERNSTIPDVAVTETSQEESDAGSLTDTPVPLNLRPFNSADTSAPRASPDSRMQLRRK